MIYFIRPKGKGPIKIGQTINMAKRLEGYKYTLGPDIEVLGVMDGGRQDEKRILEMFSHLRVSASVVNEWRDPAPDLLEYIKTSCRPWAGENDLPAGRQETIHHYKADDRAAPANRQWLAELSAFAHLQTPVMIDQALALYAKSIGFTKQKPCRRVTKRKAV